MKLIFEYSTHDRPSQNNWIKLREENEPENPEDGKSPWNGEEALISMKFYPIDNCVIKLFPAAASRDKNATTADSFKDKYLVIFSNVDESQVYNSLKIYDWEEAIKIAAMFRNLSFQAGLRVWKVKKF